MILISHRGNINGKNIEFENDPDYINKALQAGYNCEIDVYYENEKWFLGHDKPQYEISLSFILINNLWLHAKTVKTLHKLMNFNVNCFYHYQDECTLTSQGFIWTYPGCYLENKSICVLPETTNQIIKNCAGICSDFIEKYKILK